MSDPADDLEDSVYAKFKQISEKKPRVTRFHLQQYRERLRMLKNGDPYDSDPELRRVVGEG